MSIGGGSKKESQSSQSSGTNWDYGTNVWGSQSPFLTDLFSRSQANLNANPNSDMAGGYLGGAGLQLVGSNAMLNQSNQALGALDKPGADPVLQAYATNLGQQFNEQFLPGLQGDAALAGGLGGSRQQIGAALGAQRAMQTLGDFTAQNYAGQQERALQAALGMGQNAQTMQAGSQSQLALADFARSMPWYSLGQYAGLLGAPIVQDLGGYGTTQSTSKGKGSGWNASVGLGGG